jgi:hypothetical protein
MGSADIGFGENRDDAITAGSCGAHDAQGNFTPIGDQY